MRVTQVWRRVRAGACSLTLGYRSGVALAARRGRLPHTLMARLGRLSGGAVLTRFSPNGTLVA